MSEDMNLSVNGQSQVPPGFRFHPTEEELLHYYLRKKVAYQKIDLDVIRDVDLNKLEPWDIQEKCKIGSTPQNDWYFFSHKDKKYPTGTRTNRATAAGFWKATGRDKVIHSNFRRIGMRKTLVFYKGRAPHGQKSDWIMHEYRLEDNSTTHDSNASNLLGGESSTEDGWVVCRVFKKKNYHRVLESPQSSSASRTQMQNSTNDCVLDQILQYMGRSCTEEHQTLNINSNNSMNFVNPINMARFLHLPRLESPSTTPTIPNNSSAFNRDVTVKECGQSIENMLEETVTSYSTKQGSAAFNINMDIADHDIKDGLSNWVALDHLVASQLNGQEETSKQSPLYGDPNDDFCLPVLDHHENVQSPDLGFNTVPHHQVSDQLYSSEIDMWRLARPSSSSSDPFFHLSE